MRINLIAGLGLGLFVVGLLTVLSLTGSLREPIGARLLPLGWVAHAVVLFIALWLHRRAASPDAVPFSRLLAAGLMISFLAGAVVFGGTLLFLEHVDPGYLDWLRAQALEQLDEAEVSLLASAGSASAEADASPEIADELEAIAMQRQQLSDMGPVDMARQGFSALLFLGLFFSLALSALLRLRARREAGIDAPGSASA